MEVTNNLDAWDHARTAGTAETARQVLPMTAAAKEIFNDPRWVAKLMRSLAQSDQNDTMPLSEYLENAG